ncbi:MAG TPA: uridine diphosphate-N-acetylglucosamine-binding protein YvcK [Actinomycetes bacterium]|nr:uridine diphosphate-N-acetylglucosamine-binding protein YvcK [Actinomycetes bacterium]
MPASFPSRPLADPRGGPAVVALGGGHGLAASLTALRRVTDRLTAVVTVADDGGSSGRLRRELGVLPPGDLRMALAALCGDDDWGRTWSDLVQHRFRGDGELRGHAVGNLLIVALWELLGDTVPALDLVGRLLRAEGRVLPMCSVPLDLEATVVGADAADPDGVTSVRGQVAVASTPGRVAGLRLVPDQPPACAEAVTAVRYADWVVLGPGSWFSSVIPHLLVPELAAALCETTARRAVVLNLAPQPGETSGFSPETHLEVLAAHAPGLRLDVVIVDPRTVAELGPLQRVAAELGARLVVRPVSAADGSPRHDPTRLAAAFAATFAGTASARPTGERSDTTAHHGRI